MQNKTTPFCPVRPGHGECEHYGTSRDSYGFVCNACGGRFEILRSAFVSYFGEKLSDFHGAVLSHQLNTFSRDSDSTAPVITMDWMAHFERNARLPSPPQQATNLIRLIGDQLSKTGEGFSIGGEADVARVGAFNLQMLVNLRKELETKGIVQELGFAQGPSGSPSGKLYGLTLDGWERYEAERRGQVVGHYGFIAMKFNDEDLERFVEQTVKPAVRNNIGYELVDIRDGARAGVIDNIMREKIRDAAFVLADLTHDNSGAYWEAGYAEGLGKPVVYLCEREKFGQSKTHFDTNHCTTVVWSVNEPDAFQAELIATLRRSLNLFPTAASERSDLREPIFS